MEENNFRIQSKNSHIKLILTIYDMLQKNKEIGLESDDNNNECLKILSNEIINIKNEEIKQLKEENIKIRNEIQEMKNMLKSIITKDNNNNCLKKIEEVNNMDNRIKNLDEKKSNGGKRDIVAEDDFTKIEIEKNFQIMK